MIEQFERIALPVIDLLLGWTLALPSDISLLALAIASTAVLAGVRFLATPRAHLRHCAADRRRLRELIREARARGDGMAVRRHLDLFARISNRVLLAGILPALISIPLFAALVSWGFHRLQFRPPQAGRPFRMTAVFPESAAGDVVHISPDESGGLTAEGGWIREIAMRPDGRAVAEWTLRGAARPEPYRLRIHRATGSWEHEIRIGGLTPHASPGGGGDGNPAIEVVTGEVKLFTVIPGIPALLIPAWLVGYLLLTIPLTLLVRRTLRIA